MTEAQLNQERMNEERRERLEVAGYRFGSAQEFLELSEDDMKAIEERERPIRWLTPAQAEALRLLKLWAEAKTRLDESGEFEEWRRLYFEVVPTREDELRAAVERLEGEG